LLGVDQFETQGRPTFRPGRCPDRTAAIKDWHHARAIETNRAGTVRRAGGRAAAAAGPGGLLDWALLAEVQGRPWFRRYVKR
jgi:hypothetical protein